MSFVVITKNGYLKVNGSNKSFVVDKDNATHFICKSVAKRIACQVEVDIVSLETCSDLERDDKVFL